MTFDDWTFWIWISYWPLYLVWEIVLLVKRGQRVNVRTLSMVAQQRAWQLVTPVYLTTGLAAHWWINWPPSWEVWSTPVPGIVFWIIPVALLVWDILWWKRPKETWPKVAKYVRWPALVAGEALLLGFVLFPQRGPMPWSF